MNSTILKRTIDFECQHREKCKNESHAFILIDTKISFILNVSIKIMKRESVLCIHPCTHVKTYILCLHTQSLSYSKINFSVRMALVCIAYFVFSIQAFLSNFGLSSFSKYSYHGVRRAPREWSQHQFSYIFDV